MLHIPVKVHTETGGVHYLQIVDKNDNFVYLNLYLSNTLSFLVKGIITQQTYSCWKKHVYSIWQICIHMGFKLVSDLRQFIQPGLAWYHQLHDSTVT